jgi:hypothetical protein
MQGLFEEPSAGLEPATPSLPWQSGDVPEAARRPKVPAYTQGSGSGIHLHSSAAFGTGRYLVGTLNVAGGQPCSATRRDHASASASAVSQARDSNLEELGLEDAGSAAPLDPVHPMPGHDTSAGASGPIEGSSKGPA